MAGNLTPMQRHDLVTRVSEKLCVLDDLLAPIRIHALGEVDGLEIRKALDDLYEAVREMAEQIDWPGPRPGVRNGSR